MPETTNDGGPEIRMSSPPNGHRGCRSIALVLAGLLAGALIQASEPVELRGYGKVDAGLSPDRAVFACESVAKAEILLDKLQADLAWDRLLPLSRSEVQVGATKLAVFSAPGYGSAMIARSGSSVIVYDTGIFHVNGTKVATYQAHGWSQTYSYDVTALVTAGANVVALEAVGGKQLGGLRGCVWIETWDPLSPAQDLAGPWQAVQGDWIARNAVDIPGSAPGKYLTRSLQIPADWKGLSVYLEWSSRNQWIGSVVVNGMPMCNNNYAHPYGLWARINVTPFLKPGESNTIEAWPFMTMSPGLKPTRDAIDALQLDSIRIGCQ